MSANLYIDVVLTPKLWLADEMAWRVDVLNVPGSTAEGLYSEGGLRKFKVDRDRVFWMGPRDEAPLSATLGVSIPANLRSHHEYEQQCATLEKAKQGLERDSAAMASRQRARLLRTAAITTLVGAGIGFATTAAVLREGSKMEGTAGRHECRQALARLETLSSTSATAADVKKAVQREVPVCLSMMDLP